MAPTDTTSPTPSATWLYIIQENDTLSDIVEINNLGESGVILILMLNPYTPTDLEYPGIDPQTQIIFIGQKIWLPYPGMPVPTPSPWPLDAAPGTYIRYFVLPLDSLGGIATKCFSTVDAIIRANPELLADGAATTLQPGWILVVPVNLIAPSATSRPTRTSTSTFTITPTRTTTP